MLSTDRAPALGLSNSVVFCVVSLFIVGFGNGNPLEEFWIKEFVEDLLDEHGLVKWIEAPERVI
ncbi:MAG: hypothetical protein ABSB10_03355 [Candidatus Bathyarchaeia archaeon]|jgi:hypothetical protein